MPFAFTVREGKLDCDGVYLAEAISGAAGHVNNPADEALAGLGPLPEGWYSMSPAQDNDTGPDSIILTPDADTQMYGRSGMRIHGFPIEGFSPEHTGSHGCIETNRGARLFMLARISRGDNRLQVVSSLAVFPTDVELGT